MSKVKPQKEDKYVVVKIADLEEYLSNDSYDRLREMLEYISVMRKRAGKSANPQYIMCNQDEPYAEDVWQLILDGEYAKELAGEAVES